MAKGRWLIWGLIFSAVIFLAAYILIYKRVVENPTAILMLGNMDISFMKGFLSNMKNIVISSIILGFILGAIPVIGSGRKEDSIQVPQK